MRLSNERQATIAVRPWLNSIDPRIDSRDYC